MTGWDFDRHSIKLILLTIRYADYSYPGYARLQFGPLLGSDCLDSARINISTQSIRMSVAQYNTMME
jgi:hypothetical protein